MKYFFVVALVSGAFFSKAFASPQITEVMYDPKSGGEWVEVHNPDDTAVDLKGWKLFDGSSHSISASASVMLPAGGYIILADDKNAFVSAFNDVTVPIVDIVTSMNNDGDTVILRNPSGTDISTVTYGVNAGASKNDKSLQLIGSEYLPWFVSIGTAASVTKEEVEAATSASGTNTTNNTTSSNTNIIQTTSPYHAWPSDMEIFVSAGGDKVSVAGAEVTFQGRVISAARKPLPNADLIWTFGDGGSDRGTQVKHIFHYPGKYVVLLDVVSGDNIAKDQIFVEVIQPKISISRVESGEHSFIEVFNSSVHDLDIGGWVLESNGLGGTHFTIPKNTIILAGRKVIFPSEVTKLLIVNENVRLKFPNDGVVAEYGQEEKGEVIATSTQNDFTNTDSAQQEVSLSSTAEVLGDFLSKHISTSFFDTNPETPIQDVDISTTSQELGTSSYSEMTPTGSENTALAATGLLGASFIKTSSLRWMLLLVLGIISIIGALKYIDSVEKKESGLSDEVDEYTIIE